MKQPTKITPDQLVPMDLFVDDFPLRVELAYARADNLLFAEQIYRADARLWLHKDLANIVLKASELCHDKHGLRCVLYDGLRTTDAQEKMLHTKRVQDNPHWLEEPRLLSPPGTGGHPRGMAIDLALETMEGELLDMGTPFDYLTEERGPNNNPAHRDYIHNEQISANRKKLEEAMMQAAEILDTPLLPLPQEWWDFRLPRETHEQYAPLADADLPPEMRCL